MVRLGEDNTQDPQSAVDSYARIVQFGLLLALSAPFVFRKLGMLRIASVGFRRPVKMKERPA